MKQKQPTVDELNRIQAEWMKLDPFSPDAEKQRVFKLMEAYPQVYVSGHDGLGVCIYHGEVFTVNQPFQRALAQAKQYGGRTDVAWNGEKGIWYAI